MRILLPVVILLAVTGASCKSKSTPTSPTPGAPYSQTDLRVGAGAEAMNGRTATVNYTGWLYNPVGVDGKGTQFDSSAGPGRGPFAFVVGTGNVIQGWHRGVPGMRVGGLRRLVLPPELAYGSTGSGPIPPNATLVFDIELLSVQ